MSMFTDQSFRRELSSVPGFNPKLTEKLVRLYEKYGYMIHPYFYVYLYTMTWAYDVADECCEVQETLDDFREFMVRVYSDFMTETWPGLDFADDLRLMTRFIRKKLEFDVTCQHECITETIDYVLRKSTTIERQFAGLVDSGMADHYRNFADTIF